MFCLLACNWPSKRSKNKLSVEVGRRFDKLCFARRRCDEDWATVSRLSCGLSSKILLGGNWRRSDSAAVQPLLAALAAELERERELTRQVAKYLSENYGLERDAVGSFLENELVRVEDFEIDLILSPLFTPTLQDQSVFAELLGSASVPRERWPDLIDQLVARPTYGRLGTENGQANSVPLREVTIERYVSRLRLDGTIHE